MAPSSSKKLFIYVNTAVVAFAIALLGYWYFIDGTLINVPLVDKADMMNLRVDKEIYSPGDDILVYNSSFCKYRELPASITVQLVDGEVVSMTTRENNLPPGCYGDRSFPVIITTIPKVISPGEWYLRWTVVFQVNPIKKIIYTRKTQEFQISSPILPIAL